MENLIKLFDSLLTLMLSFPSTIFHVLTSPNKVVGIEPSAHVSPPGATLVVSLMIWYCSHSMETRIKAALDLPFIPSKTFIIRVFVLVIFVLLVQYIFLFIPSIVPMPPVDAAKTVTALSYPVSVMMTIYGFVYLVYILFPFLSRPHGMTVKERLDPIFREVRKESHLTRIVVEEDASFFAFLAGSLAYICALYNILRELFKLKFDQAIFPTITLLIISLLLMILFLYVVFERLDGLVDKLRSQKEAMPNDKNTGKEH
jgi:hypothetical protein